MENLASYMSGNDLKDALVSSIDGVLYQKLVLHAIVRLRGRYGQKGSTSEIEDTACELVQELLESMIVDQSRNWNINKYPELEDFLRSAIDSHLYNHFSRNKTIIQDIDSLNGDGRLELSGQAANPENEFITEELKNEVRSLLAKMNADDDEMMIFECLFDGLRKPKSIREELGLSELEFGSIWRRVKRKQEKLQEKLF